MFRLPNGARRPVAGGECHRAQTRRKVAGGRAGNDARKCYDPGNRTKAGGAGLDRLGGSIDAAQQALGDLRRELSKGGRDVVKDLDALLRDARKNLRSARRTLAKHLEEVQKVAAGSRRPAARRAAAKRATTAARSGGASARKANPRTARKVQAPAKRGSRQQTPAG